MKDSGMWEDRQGSMPESNGKSQPASKRNVKGSPSSTPWSGGRPNDAGHTRTSSNKDGIGPARPSDSRPSKMFDQETGGE